MLNPKAKKIAGFILLYYAIAMVLRYYLIVIKPDFYVNLNDHLQGLLAGVSPLVAGLILVKLFKRPNDLTLFSTGIWKTTIAVLFPVFLFFIVGTINTGALNFSILTTVTVAIIYAFFEEYGWRGYLQSELKGVKRIYKYLIISVLWYFWHLDFGLDGQHLLSYAFVLAGSIGIGYVADKSKSLPLVSLFHMFFNVFFTNTLDGVTFSQKAIILSCSIVVVIFVMWKDKKEKKAAISKLTS